MTSLIPSSSYSSFGMVYDTPCAITILKNKIYNIKQSCTSIHYKLYRYVSNATAVPLHQDIMYIGTYTIRSREVMQYPSNT